MQSAATLQEMAFQALDSFQIEIPSWGFANTGTRFGKFLQAGAASTLEEKFSDAGQVHMLTGVTPTLALHVLWDLPNGVADCAVVHQLEVRIMEFLRDQSIRISSRIKSTNLDRCAILPWRFENVPSAHMLDSVAIARELGSRDISLWLPDGSNYPGTQSMRKRIEWLEEGLVRTHERLAPNQRCWSSTSRLSRPSITPTSEIGEWLPTLQ